LSENKTLHLPAAARPGKCITRLQLHDGELKGWVLLFDKKPTLPKAEILTAGSFFG